ncbi:MAG TPA: hypothetical protein PJ991_11895 [Kiritimatiellia bacterium]|nr:hypothetical protein [Kiritimatiellia bacterium]
MIRRVTHFAAVFFCTVLVSGHTRGAGDTFELVSLDNHAIGSRATAINEQDWIVGEIENGDEAVQAFLWKPDIGITMLGTLGGQASRGYSINRHGVVVGESADEHGITRAFIWSEQDGMVPLPAPDGILFSAAYAINDHGFIVGSVEARDGMQAVLWRDGTIIILPRLPGSGNIQALDINTRGDVIGHIKTGSEELFGSHAFYFYDAVKARNLTTFTLLSHLSGSAAVALNDRGDAGGYIMRDAARVQAFLYSRRKGTRMLDDGEAIYSTVYGINNLMHAVGSRIASYDSDESACLWKDGEMIDLNELPGIPSDWWLVQATGINDKGSMIGNGLNHDINRAFLLRKTDHSTD